MAITKTIKLRNGLTVPDAYIRIDAFMGSKSGITYSVNVYISEQSFRGTGGPGEAYLEQTMLEFMPDPSPDAPHMWEQLYADLKAQEQFAGAVDA